MKSIENKEDSFFKVLFEYVLIILGCAISAFGIESILIPNHILDGGVTGIAMVLNILTNWKLSILVVVINIPFVIIGYKNLGFRFLLRTIFCLVVYSLFFELFRYINFVLTNDILLATVYGSFLQGIGCGLVIRYGGILDGTECLGVIISKKTKLSVGQFILYCNIVIFTVSAFVIGIDRSLFSLLVYFISSQVIDKIDEGMEQAKAAMIVCDNGKEMANIIYEKIGRTCTMLQGNGFISGKKAVLYCVITRIEINELRNIVLHQEHSAFISISDVSEIIGNHIKSHQIKKKIDK